VRLVQRQDAPVRPAAGGLDRDVDRPPVLPDGLGLPAEEALVEGRRLLRLARLQLVPGEAPGVVDPAGAGVPPRLPGGEHRARGILHDRRPAGVQDVEGLLDHRPAQLVRPDRRGVGVLDAHVAEPVGPHAPLPLPRRPSRRGRRRGRRPGSASCTSTTPRPACPRPPSRTARRRTPSRPAGPSSPAPPSRRCRRVAIPLSHRGLLAHTDTCPMSLRGSAGFPSSGWRVQLSDAAGTPRVGLEGTAYRLTGIRPAR